MSHEIIHWDSHKKWKMRLIKTENLITSLNLPEGAQILDIGGRDYTKYCKNKKYLYTSIDLAENGVGGGTNGGWGGRKKGVIGYNGRDLPFNEPIFDLIIIGFVFHHANNNTLFLLEQIKNTSKKYILIGEDLSGLDYEDEWYTRNFDHEPRGIFRSDEEWQILFKLYKLKLLKQYIIHQDDDLSTNKIYRCLYLLQK
jgi:hypothetical protein